jgi:hypothetical protein
VDFKPTCGNILSGGPQDMGLITATGNETTVNIHAVNTGARVTSANIAGWRHLRRMRVNDGVLNWPPPRGPAVHGHDRRCHGRLPAHWQILSTLMGSTDLYDVAMPMVIARAG